MCIRDRTNTLTDHLRAVRHIGGAIIGWKAIIKGLGLLWKLKRAGVKRYRGVESFSVIGQTDVEGIRVVRSGQTLDIECEQVFLHQGVVPNTQLSRALQLDHEWSDLQRCFKPVTDTWGKTSNPRVYVAGDGAGIGGAIAAELRGSLCAINVLSELGKIDAQSLDSIAKPKLRALSKELALRPFLDVLYPVPDFIANPDDSTLICRCEEVSAGAIREYAKLGCMGPNQTKAFGRPGMGPCQGRNCGLTVTEILARAHNKPAAEIGAYKIRMPIKPVSLGEMASLAETQTNNQANNQTNNQIGGEEGQ